MGEKWGGADRIRTCDTRFRNSARSVYCGRSVLSEPEFSWVLLMSLLAGIGYCRRGFGYGFGYNYAPRA